MHEPLMDFLKDHQDIDIFCFQEVYHNARGKDTIWLDGTNFNSLNDIKNALPDYDCYFHPHLSDWWGLAAFVRKGIEITEAGEEYVHLYKGHNMEIEKLGHTAKNIQYLHLLLNGRPFTIINFHGLWNGKGKTDTEARLNQSRKIIDFTKTVSNPLLFCGDFNLLPETESLQMIEHELGLRNLIKEYNINSTRTHLYTKPEKFADYVFVSPEVTVAALKVLPEVVSDHVALYAEIE